MDENGATISVTILCFGPLAEIIGRSQEMEIEPHNTCRDLIIKLGLTEWLDNGLKVALNGDVCKIDSLISPNDEVAFLPPVSGG